MLCPDCGSILDKMGAGEYMCNNCMKMLREDEVIHVSCPRCGEELSSIIGDDYYCNKCGTVKMEDAVQSSDVDFDDDFDEPDYDSMINDGSEVCLNCTYWSASPYGASHGMVCRRGYPTDGPGDSCSEFVQAHSYANYGDNGQYQFDETDRDISNKLYHWRNNR